MKEPIEMRTPQEIDLRRWAVEMAVGCSPSDPLKMAERLYEFVKGPANETSPKSDGRPVVDEVEVAEIISGVSASLRESAAEAEKMGKNILAAAASEARRGEAERRRASKLLIAAVKIEERTA